MKGKRSYSSFILIAISCIHFVDAVKIKSGRIRQGYMPEKDHLNELLIFVRNVYLVAITPVILMFLHSVLTDPMIPTLRSKLGKIIKSRMMNHLSGDNEDEQSDSKKDIEFEDGMISS